jgi:hypothetical protein
VGRDEALEAWKWLRPVQRSWARSGVEIARHPDGIGRPKDGLSLRSRIARSAAGSRTAGRTRGAVGVAHHRLAGPRSPKRFPSVHRGSPLPRTHASSALTPRSRPPRMNTSHQRPRTRPPKRQIRSTAARAGR